MLLVEMVSLGKLARSTASTFNPWRASSIAVVAPATRVPMMIASNTSALLLAIALRGRKVGEDWAPCLPCR
jgi:hypothetical protein